MICTVVEGYTPVCGPISGGIARLWVGDPNDFDWTQDNATDEHYSAVARAVGATDIGGGNLFQINFEKDEAEYKAVKTTNVPSAIKYEHSLVCQLPALTKEANVFIRKMDTASICCGLILVMQMNSGKIFVIGEALVNTAGVPPFDIRLTDVEQTSGKKFDDYSGSTVTFKGDYNRPAREFTGGLAGIQAMEPSA